MRRDVSVTDVLPLPHTKRGKNLRKNNNKQTNNKTNKKPLQLFRQPPGAWLQWHFWPSLTRFAAKHTSPAGFGKRMVYQALPGVLGVLFFF